MLMATSAAGLILSFLLVMMCHRRVGAVRVVATGITYYISAYLVVSGLLLWAGDFSMQLTSALLLPLFGLACIAYGALSGNKPGRVSLELKNILPLAIILLAAALVSWTHHAEVHNTGQDEGLYQMRAMYYLGGRYDLTVSFPEYRNVDGSWDKSTFIELYENMDGLYLDDRDSETEVPRGVLHGVATFSALLALWGKLFGMSAMPGVLIVCYLTAIANVWLICRNLRLRPMYANVAAAVYAASPMVLWNAENTLTEIVLCTLLTGCFVELSEPEGGLGVLSALPLAGFCFLHITITIMMPIIVLLYWGNYLYSGKKGHLYGLLIVLLMYALGFSMMDGIAWKYLHSNMDPVYKLLGYKVHAWNGKTFVWSVVVMTGIGTGILALRGERGICKRLVAGFRKSKRARRIAAILVIIVMAVILVFDYRVIRGDELWVWMTHLLIYELWMMTGFLLLPISIGAVIRKGGRRLKDQGFVDYLLVLCYVMLVFGVVLGGVVRSFYYHGRYMTPYIFLPIVLAGYPLKRVPRKLLPLLGALLIAAMVITNPLPYTRQDMTYTNYHVIENITGCIGERDAVLIYEQGYGIHRIYTLPIKGLTGADVYYLNPDQPERMIRHLEPLYENIYVLQFDVGRDPLEGEELQVVYAEDTEGWIYDFSPDARGAYPDIAADMSNRILLRRLEQKER